MYQPRRVSRTEQIPIRGLTYQVRLWGEPAAGQPPLVLAHGWMDVAASWQFVVDALAADRFILAPDWRGFGGSVVPGADSFWFPDYLADLEALLDHYAPGATIDLVGHSMGGNVAMLYAGVRPSRVRRLVNLEGFGLPATRPAQAPGRLAQWLDQVRGLHQGEVDLRPYPSAEAVAARLTKNNPRLPADKAAWLARHWAGEQADGWRILAQPAHKITSAYLYRVDETTEIHRRITAPTLWVQAEEDSLAHWKGGYSQAEAAERLAVVAQLRRLVIPEAGHMLHHDQPQAVAHAIETFFSETD